MMAKRILRWTGFIVLTPVLIFIIFFILLYVPPIQNFLRKKVVTIASDATGMQIEIERISLSFPLDLVVQNVEVIDKQDTLLSASELMVKVQLLPLIRKRIEVNGIRFQDVRVNSAGLIDGMRVEGVLGQFFLESHGVDLSSETVNLNKVKLNDTNLKLCLTDIAESKSDSTSTPLNWKVLLHQLSLQNVTFILDMPVDSLNLYTHLGEAMVKNGTVNLRTGLYQLSLFKLADSEVHFDFGDKKEREGFDPSHIVARNINIQLDSLKYHGQNIAAQIKQFTLNERSGLSVTSLKGSIVSNDKFVKVPSLRLETPYSYMDLMLLADWATIYKPETGEGSVRLSADIGKQDVLLFTGHLSDDFKENYPFRPLILRTSLEGNMQDLRLNELRAELPGAFRFIAEGQAQAVLDSINRRACVELDASTGNLDFILSLLEENSRKSFAIPQNMSLMGEASMKGKLYDADFTFTEGMGRIVLDASYDSGREIYDASLTIDSLKLTDFMPKDSLYMLTASITAHGEGIDFFSPKTTMNANFKVDTFNYAIYNLSGIEMVASLEQSLAKVTLNSHNPLIDMQARLEALLHPYRIDADLNVDLENVDLYRMHMTQAPFDAGLNFHVKASTDMKETHTVEGAVTDMRMQMEKGAFSPKNIYFSAALSPDSTMASVRAGDLKVLLNAAGDIERLMKESDHFVETLNTQFAEKTLDQNELRTCLPNACLCITAGSDNPISNYLDAFAGVDFNEFFVDIGTSPVDGINGKSYIYALHTDSLQLDTLRFDIFQDTTGVKFAGNVINGPSNKQIVFKATANGELRKHSARLLLGYFNDKGEQGLNLGIRAVLRPEGYSLHLFPEHPTIVFRSFDLNKGNYIYVGKDQHVRADVSLLDSAGTGLKLYSLPDTTALQDIAAELRRIELADVSQMIPYMPKISGLLSAETHFVQTKEELQLAADVQVEKLIYEKNPIGNVELGAVYLPGEGDDHHLDVHLNHDNHEVLEAGGIYHSSGNGLLDADITIQDFPLRLANGFIPDGLVRLAGNLGGNLNVKGELAKPMLDGEIVLDSVSGNVPQYGVRFRMDSKPIRLEKSKLIFDKYSIYTRGNNPFMINGNVDMTNFSAMTADLKLGARNYELINAKKTKESLVFGKVFVDIFSMVQGPLDGLKVRGNINLLGTTNVTYVLKDSPLTAAQDRLGELVTFVNFNDTTEVKEEELPPVTLGGIDMLMVVHIDQAARVNADLNEDGSDYIRLEGGGDLSLQYSEFNGIQLTGRYTLTSGKMKYSIMNLKNLDYTIQNGSYVDFSGNPMNPLLNITAVYKVKTAVMQDDQKRMVNFEASIIIQNTLENLSVSFDLSAPEDATIQNELAAMSDEERSKQAVAMMITGTYLGGGGGGFNMGNSLNSVLNSAIQGITNNIKAVDISLGVDMADGTDGNSHTDYSYQISKRFWNDRFNVIIGGTISSGENVQQGNQTFIDNISIEYRLDGSGTRYVKLFHDKNYDSILDGEITETGIGIVLRKKMSRMGELFIFRRNKRTINNSDKKVKR